MGHLRSFDMRIVNLDAGSYLLQTSENDLVTEEKGEKEKYPQPCLERRQFFNPIVYASDEIYGKETSAAHQCLAFLLSNKLKKGYSEMCGFVRARMSLAIVKCKILSSVAPGTRRHTSIRYRIWRMGQ